MSNGAPFPYSSPAEAPRGLEKERKAGAIAELVKEEIRRSEAKKPFKAPRRQAAPRPSQRIHNWRFTPNSGLPEFDPWTAEGA